MKWVLVFVLFGLPSNMALAQSQSDLQDYKDIYEQGRKAQEEHMKAQVQPEPSVDPEIQKLYDDAKKGWGPEPLQMMKHILDVRGAAFGTVPSERNLQAMGYAYRYYVEKADFDRASKAARIFQKIYWDAKTRFEALGAIVARPVDDVDAQAVVSYAGLRQATGIRVSATGGGGLRVSYTDINHKVAGLELRDPTVLAASAIGFTRSQLDSQLANAAQ